MVKARFLDPLWKIEVQAHAIRTRLYESVEYGYEYVYQCMITFPEEQKRTSGVSYTKFSTKIKTDNEHWECNAFLKGNTLLAPDNQVNQYR